MSAVLLLLTDEAAVTVKFALWVPELMTIFAGTMADVLPLDNVTLVLLGAFPLRLTVHVDFPGAVKLAGVQDKLDSTGGGVSVSEEVFETPLKVAVITAVVLLLTDDVVTVKFAVDDPEFTVTVPGTVADALPLDNVTLVLLGAFPLNVTVHVDVTGGVTLAGLQLRFVSIGAGWLIVTTALPPVIGTLFPEPSDAEVPAILTPVDILVVPEAIWNVTDARAPSPIAVVLKPAMTHLISPEDGVLQLADLPAAEAAPPVE